MSIAEGEGNCCCAGEYCAERRDREKTPVSVNADNAYWWRKIGRQAGGCGASGLLDLIGSYVFW